MVATQQIGSDKLVPEVRMPGCVVDLEQGLGRSGDTQFLMQFPNGRTQVILARVYMAGTRRTEQARAIILGIGTPLEAELPVTPEPKDMDRSVEQATPMDLPAELPADDIITRIDDIENFIRRLAHFGMAHRPRSMMTFHRLFSSRSCFFQSGSHAAN